MHRIETKSEICNDKPVLAGTIIPLTVILDQFASGYSMDEVNRKYPELTREQIVAALKYCNALIEHTDLQVVGA